MKVNNTLSFLIVPVLVLLTAVSCGAQDKEAASGKTYDNPYDYCKAVGTIDAPGKEYTGPAVPDSIAEGLKKEFGSPDSTPIDVFKNGTYWRCMDGNVYACSVGANIPCAEKADVSKEPTQAMKDYCGENSGSDFIPMYVTGHSTIYEWKCDGTTPVAGKAFAEVDKQGYQTGMWYEIHPGE